MSTQKFVGPKRVETVVIDELKTFGKNDVVIVHYEGGTKELMPKRTFELVATEEPSDHTTVRSKKYNEIRKLIYPILGEYVSHLGEDIEERKERKTTMLKDVLTAIGEIDMADEEMEPFFDQVLGEFVGVVKSVLYELSNSVGRAVSLLWTGDDSIFVPGTNPMSRATFLESIKIVNERTKAK